MAGDAQRFLEIEELYQAALKLAPLERSMLLVRADPGLRREVEALLGISEMDTKTLGEEPAPRVPPEAAVDALDPMAPGAQLGPYRVEAVVGVGGMGQVYRAVDTRLGRKVAIKVSTQKFSGRFEREARAISALNHPHICTLYDVGVLPSGLNYLVTELVEGETLRDWLKGAPAVERCMEIAREVLEALRAAHGAGIVHRDLKPENIMVRRDGYVKVLDFGLAKWMPDAPGAADGLSIPGQIMGTVAYMPPEQILGEESDPRSDLFSFGIILYEMLAGRRPWPHKAAVDLMHAIVHDDPAPMSTAPTVAPVVNKLLRKLPEDRYPSAAAVLEALARPAPASEVRVTPGGRTLTRLIVLPFRILRRHESSDFLSVSLPDAITSSLSAIDSLVVRSTMAASRFAASELDVKTIAEQAQVDAILTGTILSDGEYLRVNTQLVEAPDGTLLWSNTSHVSLQDIFQLQDEMVDRIVQALAVPLTAREQRALKHDVPGGALAYEFYLRGNQMVATEYSPQNMILARDLYLRAVEADPNYAPAWACLGRVLRFIGKYRTEDQAANFARAEEAFGKAFALNSELALAHNFYTALETDLGRSLDAMERLLKRAHTHPNDLNLLVGLVQACRYCDLLEPSLAAHALAKRLDPQVRTSVAYTYLRLNDYRNALEYAGPTDGYVHLPALMALGRGREAIEWAEGLAGRVGSKQPIPYDVFNTAVVEGDRTTGLEALDRILELTSYHTSDPEARFCTAAYLAKLNDPERALEFISLALDRGYSCHHALLHDPWLDSLRSHSRFTELVGRAAAMSLHARTVFLDNGGDRLLGAPPSLT